MSLRPALHGAGTPYTEDTGLICRVPSRRLDQQALGYSPRGTCVGSRYGLIVRPHWIFHGNQESAEDGVTPSSSRLHPLLVITTLHGLAPLEQAGKPVRPIPIRFQGQNTVRYRNINLFPFRHSRLRYALGPTNPRLTNIVEEP